MPNIQSINDSKPYTIRFKVINVANAKQAIMKAYTTIYFKTFFICKYPTIFSTHSRLTQTQNIVLGCKKIVV